MRSSIQSCAVLVLAAIINCGGSDKGASAPEQPPPPGPPGCGLQQAAFCDTFDTPSPGGRGGDLDDTQWSVARISTFGARDVFESWRPTHGEACGKMLDGVVPDSDLFFCAGGGTASMHLNDVEDDGGGFTIHSYRIRKPFDFTNRTGVLAFDVGAKSATPGGHGIWFNITIADEPVPAPYQEGGGIALFAKAGVIIEFEYAAGGLTCKDDLSSNSVSTVFVEKDYKITNKYQYLGKTCFKTAEEVMNHVEIHLTQKSLEVYASDAGDPSTLRLLTRLDSEHDGLSLPLTRGYVNLQQTHYNAAKSEALPAYATYHWDNVGFDGPSYPVPRSYPVPDSLKSYMIAGSPTTDVGYLVSTSGLHDHDGAIAPIKLANVDLTNAQDATLTLNAWTFCPGEALIYKFNGGTPRTYACPFPLACDGCGDGNTPNGECDKSARAVVIPVDLADLKQGDNTLEISTNRTDSQQVIIANADLTVTPKP